MGDKRGTRPEAIEQWQQSLNRLVSKLSKPVGLMHMPFGQALHAAAQPALPPAPTQAETPEPALAWRDWWHERSRLESGELTARGLAQASLQRLDDVQPSTNACVEIWQEEPLRQAAESDARIAASQALSMLDGMPLAHKDLLWKAGAEFTYGMGQAGGVADMDATVLRLLDSSGGLHLARIHMTELAFDPAGVNEMAGHCRNPWSVEHIPGGSSSGSAAVVATGAVMGAIGSDTGGSIRIPSILCGITGLKPTFGLVSRAGAMTLSQTNDHLGPMARSARDCALMLQAMAMHDAGDAGSVTAPQGNTDYLAGLGRPVAGIRIGVPESYFNKNLHPDVQTMLQASLERFREMGAQIRPVPDFPYDDINALAVMIIRAEATAMYEDLANDAESALGKFTRVRLKEGVEIPASMYLQALGLRGPLLLQFVETVLAEVDVMLAPVFAHATPRIDEFAELNERSLFLRNELTRLTRPINFLGLPSLAVPGGFVSCDGVKMPTGFQLIGRPYAESLLLQLGHAFQVSADWKPDQLPMPAQLPWD